MDWESATKENYYAVLAVGVILVLVGTLQLSVEHTVRGVVILLGGAGLFALAYRIRQHHPEW